MKIRFLPFISVIVTLLLLLDCQKPEKQIKKQWLGKSLDFNQLRSKTDYFNMFDSTGTKVGSMTFGTYFENSLFVARDTSQLDDGSFYETAEFTMDSTSMTTKKVTMDLTIQQLTKVEIDLEAKENGIVGN